MPSFGFDADYFDEHFRFVGHTTGGVSIECRKCNMRGHPIAYLGDESPFQMTNPPVVHAATPSALILAGQQHLSRSIHHT
jgi:hypothetical protein